MGLIAETVRTLARLVPEAKVAVGAAVPTWQQGVGQGEQPPFIPYHKAAREGYGGNEVVFACIEELATSAAEPRLAAYQLARPGPEKLPAHPTVDLLEHPNPFMDRFSLIASIIMYLNIAGNAYVEKVRAAAGNVVELWLLRPDRVRVIPDTRRFVGGYRYEIGNHGFTLPAADVIHLRTRHPLDDYYGLAPLAVIAARADTDNWMRAFTRSFFTNAGVPAGLLNIRKKVEAAERELIRGQWRGQFAGPQGWHGLLVLDDTEASYTAMGMPLGERGIVLPELDEIDEARLAMVFGVPLELIGARLGMIHGNRSTTKEARATFWHETLIPLYQQIAAGLSMGLMDEPWGTAADYLAFDLATVEALQEDADKKHTRIREDAKAGLITRQEARQALGYEAAAPADGEWLLATTVRVLPVGADIAGSAPALPPGPREGTEGDEDADPDEAKTWLRYELKAADPSGLIVCLAVPPALAAALAVAGGEPPEQLHATLAYLGESTPATRRQAGQVVAQLVGRYGPLVGTVSGVGRFSGLPGQPDAVYASLDVPALAPFRQVLVRALQAAGLPVVHTHGFSPHVTLAYIEREAYSPLTRLDPLPVVFEAVDVWAGPHHERYALRPPSVTARQPVAAGSSNGRR